MFANAARSIFPELTNTITRAQILQTMAQADQKWPNFDRISRGVYNLPESTQIAHETAEDIEARIADTFESLETLVASVASNSVNSLVVAGAPGLGKSYTVNKVLNEINHGSEYNYVFHRGYLRASHLFRLLWQNRFEGQVIVLDDTDAIFGDETALNILKAALELKPTRRIGWGSEKEFLDDDGETIPRYFDYSGSIIFLTNLPFREMIAGNSKNAPHLSALESRSLVLDLKIKTQTEYLVKIKQTIKAGMLENAGFNLVEEVEIISFLEENITKFSDISLRMVEKIAALYRANPTNWQKLCRAVCFK